MADGGITITGLDETIAMLANAPRDIVVAGFAKALNAGIQVVADELEARTPERSEGERSEDRPHLKDSIVTKVKVDADARGGIAVVGFGEMGYVANFVEYGHRMIGHRPTKKELGDVSPKPFMRPAAAAAAESAIDAFAASIAATAKSEFPNAT